jgi:hypothetical protein
MAFPETMEEAMVGPAMADQETVDHVTADDSIEEAFFERATASSDRPVSFDTELAEPPLDLEGRELRRAHFTRVVGAIIATLGIGALLALVQPGSNAAEAAPMVAAYVPPLEMAEIQVVEPTPALPAPSASVPTSRQPHEETVPRSRTLGTNTRR